MADGPGTPESNSADSRIEDGAESTSFGALLREHRIASALTQESLAARAGLGERGIQDLERGLHQPHRQTAQRLVQALGLAGEARQHFELLAGAGQRGRQPSSPIRAFVPRIIGRTGAERGNLLLQPTALIGRESEVATVVAMLRDSSCRLITLTGPGGIGKSRLAFQVARDVLESYADGAWLIELAALADADLLPSAVATAFGIREEPGETTLAALHGALQSRDVLLVLDNCERLVNACAALTRTLLQTCPGVTILTTSRERLGTSGEIIWRVPSLAIASTDHLPSVEVLLDYAAVRLFVERAHAVESRFELTPENAGAVAEICRRLDGMPLAIELAAARVRALTPAQIARRLDDRFRLLVGNDRAGTPRHATLRAAVEWSHDLLDDGERILFRRLAVFAGSWSLEGAEAVCTADGITAAEVLDLLTSLVDKSLVIVDDGVDQTRYRSLETIRQYAWERLEQAEETESLRLRHRQFYLALAERAEFEVWNVAQMEWLNRLELEHDNIRVALRECSETDPEAGLRLAGALWRFWCDRCHHQEARSWLEAALAEAPEDAPARGRALYAFGMVSYSQGDFARSELERSLPILRANGDSLRLSHALAHLGNSAQKVGDFLRARAALEESLATSRRIGDCLLPTATVVLAYLGELELAEGHADQAEQRWLESLDLCRQVGDLRCWNFVLWNLGALARARGDLPRAQELIDESLVLAWKIGHGPGVRRSLREQAALAQSRGNYHRSVRLLAASEQVFGRATVTWITPPDALSMLMKARKQIGDDLVDRTWAEGQAMTLEQAVTDALREGGG